MSEIYLKQSIIEPDSMKTVENRVHRFKLFLAGQTEGPIWSGFNFNHRVIDGEFEKHAAFAEGLGAPELVMPEAPNDETVELIAEQSGLLVVRQVIALDLCPNAFCAPGSLYVNYYGDSQANQAQA